jgi:hypothetical protein
METALESLSVTVLSLSRNDFLLRSPVDAIEMMFIGNGIWPFVAAYSAATCCCEGWSPLKDEDMTMYLLFGFMKTPPALSLVSTEAFSVSAWGTLPMPKAYGIESILSYSFSELSEF